MNIKSATLLGMIGAIMTFGSDFMYLLPTLQIIQGVPDASGREITNQLYTRAVAS